MPGAQGGCRAWKGNLGRDTPRSQGPPSSRTSSTARSRGSATTRSAASQAWQDTFDYHQYLRGPTPRELSSAHQPSDLDAIPNNRRHIFKHLLEAPGAVSAAALGCRLWRFAPSSHPPHKAYTQVVACDKAVT